MQKITQKTIMKTEAQKHAELILAGIGISSLYLDSSNSTPRVRMPSNCAKRAKEISNWRICYLGTGKLALVPREVWEEFCCTAQKAFKRENPNKNFDEWVRDFAKDAQLHIGKAGVRLPIPPYLFEWAKIPITKGTKLYLYRQNIWLLLSLTEKTAPSLKVPNSTTNQPAIS